MSFITIDRVSKEYADPRRGTTVALSEVDLHIEHNEFVVLLGPSGCGKSTLLNVVAGFEGPSSGEVRMEGRTIAKPGPDRGIVFQAPTLMPWLPVWENVAFHRRLQGDGKRARRAAAQRYIDTVGLGGFEEHLPGELSGGMSQRVSIARALLLNPAVILMDEPFAALDSQTRMELQEELVRIWQTERCTIVFVTHSIEEAIILGTKIVVMTPRPGRITRQLDVPLTRPRDTTSPAFNDLKRDLLALGRGAHAA
jgi:NitT/TauT family transport system ATP-binding protein